MNRLADYINHADFMGYTVAMEEYATAEDPDFLGSFFMEKDTARKIQIQVFRELVCMTIHIPLGQGCEEDGEVLREVNSFNSASAISKCLINGEFASFVCRTFFQYERKSFARMLLLFISDFEGVYDMEKLNEWANTFYNSWKEKQERENVE